MPEVRGQPEADAIAAVEAAELQVGEVQNRSHASIPAGNAVRTEPAAGEMVEMDSTVTLIVSKGPKQVDVPDVTGMPEADAVAAIEAADLAAGATSDAYSDTVPAGSVVSTTPAAGQSVDAKSAVDYVVSLGVEQVEVPELSGPAADADQVLTEASLATGTVGEEFSESVAAGDVVSQSPTPGAQVDKGSAVDYVTSLGPTPYVKVPAVRDLPEADAVAAIEGVELVVGEIIEQTHEKVAPGNAIKTEPAADEEILHGSTVTLYVSLGSNFRAVPDVAGQPAAEAQATLEGRGSRGHRRRTYTTPRSPPVKPSRPSPPPASRSRSAPRSRSS